jgi:AcrR family transcriptional regulator
MPIAEDVSDAAAATEDDPVAAANRASILEAAQRLIAVHGIEKVRLRDIAQEAGVSIGKIQHLFDTRDVVIDELLKTTSERRAAEWSHVADGIADPRARMTSLLEHAVAERERCVIWLATLSLASRHQQHLPDVSHTYDTWRATLTEVIESGVSAGVFAPTAAVRDVADAIICVIDGLMTTVAVDLNGYTAERNSHLLRHTAGLLLGTSLDQPQP